MQRCRTCVYPITKPDLHFDSTGECSACRNYCERPQIGWAQRKQDLLQLLDRHNGRCLVPSSGGKDSTYQAITLKALGADVTAVTATTCHLTYLGRQNIDNLARHVRTIEVTPNRTVRAKLNRLGLELVGDISWPEHASIFSTPFRIAKQLGIDLIFYGENPQREYGGPPGAERSREMTRRWASEFGGFLGLRPSDFIGMEGITERDVEDYQFPADIGNVEAHFLGQYLEWDSQRNADVSIAHGFRCQLPSRANYWEAENQDNAQTGCHDHAMYRKYGFSRLASQIAVDVRRGKVTRAQAMQEVKERDGLFPESYMGVPLEAVIDRIGLSRSQLMATLDKFTDWSLFNGVIDGRPILREFS